MPKQVAQLSVADNLCKLANDFKSGDAAMASAIRKEFKIKGKNDLSRVIVYLMEIVGSRDEQFKALQRDNVDLKEILKLNDINLDKGFEQLSEKEKTNGIAPGIEGSNGMATSGVDQVSGHAGVESNSGSVEGAANGTI